MNAMVIGAVIGVLFLALISWIEIRESPSTI